MIDASFFHLHRQWCNCNDVKRHAAFVDNDTISCVLKEGQTTFIIELSRNTPPDRFTFLNENAAACGELRIAVSDSALPADSPKWTEVDGIVPFAHKRLFKLSMLGVDTRFVRLSFKVDSQHQDSAQLSDPFRSSLLATNISSRKATTHIAASWALVRRGGPVCPLRLGAPPSTPR